MKPKLSRRTERIVAGTALFVALTFTAAVLLWHFGLDDLWWSLPTFPAIDGLEAFGVYPWLMFVLMAGVICVCLGTAVLFARRGLSTARPFFTFGLAAMASLGCAGIYWPLYGAFQIRFDRILGRVKEYVVSYRYLVVLLAATLIGSLLFLVVTSLKRTPPLVRSAALVPPVVLAGIYLSFSWIPMILPVFDGWEPAEWQRPEMLVMSRPCRGALLWLTRDDGRVIPFGRIDDLWLRFADPRRGGLPVPAVSIRPEMREGYLWLTAAEAGALRSRKDDPAVVRCDARWRTDPVAPAQWHTLGVVW